MNTKETTNVFMNMIYEKVPEPTGFKGWWKYRKYQKKLRRFVKDISNGSPSFGMLWKMADFIKFAEEVFFFDNSTESSEYLYSSRKYERGQNGFKITTDESVIVIKLYSNAQRVALEIDRLNGNKLRSALSFSHEQWEMEPTPYEEMLLEQVIKIINSKMLSLFWRCYEAR